MTTPLMSLYAPTLNALDEMQHSIAYAVRRPVLAEAERLIVTLDTENTALRAQLEASMQRQEQLASNVNAGLLEIRSLTTQLATARQERDQYSAQGLRVVKDCNHVIDTLTDRTAQAQATLTDTAPCGHPTAWYAVDDDANDHCIGCQVKEARERVTALEAQLDRHNISHKQVGW